MKFLIKKILKESEDLGWAQETISGELRPTPSVVVDRSTSNPKDALEVHFEIMFGDADYYDRNTAFFYKKPHQYGLNFEDFEKVVRVLKTAPRSDHDRGWREIFNNDEELRELCYDVGAIGYSEMHDYTKKGSISKIYYYDSDGNKYDARLV